MIRKIIFPIKIFLLYIFLINVSYADLQEELINKIIATKTLSFNFKQKIAEKQEVGNCFIKYPLLMRCNYNNSKKKIIIANKKRVAIIKKKYKKIYYYPLKNTPLFIILDKNKILNIIGNSKPISMDSNKIAFVLVDEKLNKLKLYFDKKSLEFRGWETKDTYSNNVSFIIDNLKINNQIVDDFFKIPKQEDF